MLTNVFRVMVKDPIKENFYEKRKKKKKCLPEFVYIFAGYLILFSTLINAKLMKLGEPMTATGPAFFFLFFWKLQNISLN